MSFDDRDNILNLIRNISQRNLNNLSKLPYLQSRKLFISLRTDDEISEFFKHFNNIEEITVKDIFYKYISSSNFKPTEIIDILKIVDSSKNTEFMANTLTSRNIFTPFTLLFKGHLSFNIFKFFLLNYIIFVILILWLFKKRKNVFEFFFKFNRYIYKKSPQSSKSNIK